MKWKLLAGAAALACVVSFAVGQQLSFRSLSGNEVVEAQLGIGGTGFFTPISQLRNSQGVAVTSSTSGTQSYTMATASLIFTAASGGSQTINLPPNPWDGEIFEIINGTASTAFTTGSVVATTDSSSIAGGSTANALGTLAAGASVEWRYSLTNTTWYRMR